MRKVKATDPSLRQYALRGVGAIRPGKEIVIVHSANNFATKITPVSEAQFLAHKLSSVGNAGKYSGGYWDEQEWMLFTATGSRYLNDMGLIPYQRSPRGSWYNESNYSLDPAFLATIGIELEF